MPLKRHLQSANPKGRHSPKVSALESARLQGRRADTSAQNVSLSPGLQLFRLFGDPLWGRLRHGNWSKIRTSLKKTDSVNLLSNATLRNGTVEPDPLPTANARILRLTKQPWSLTLLLGCRIVHHAVSFQLQTCEVAEHPRIPDAILPDCHLMACIPAKDTRTPSDLALLHQNSCSWNMIPERLLPCLRKSVPCAVHPGSVVYHWIFCHFGGPCACCASSILALIFARLCTNAKVETLRWSNYRVLGFSRTPGYLLESAYKSSWCFFWCLTTFWLFLRFSSIFPRCSCYSHGFFSSGTLSTSANHEIAACGVVRSGWHPALTTAASLRPLGGPFFA